MQISMARLASLLSLLAVTACSTGPATPADPDPALLPDLTIRRMYLEMEGRQGHCVEAYSAYGIRVVIDNIGQAGAGPFVVELNGTRQPVEESLAAGQTIVLHFAGTAPGGRYEAHVDAAGQVTEQQEDNNSLSYVAPTPTPPLLCTPASTPAK